MDCCLRKRNWAVVSVYVRILELRWWSSNIFEIAMTLGTDKLGETSKSYSFSMCAALAAHLISSKVTFVA